MCKLIDRITGIGIHPDNSSFTISSKDLLQAISEDVDLSTITDHELKEIVFIVTKAVSHMDWRATVNHAINHLPFGLNQTGIAWDGFNPCIACPDAMLFDSKCHHQGECKAWEIYEAKF